MSSSSSKTDIGLRISAGRTRNAHSETRRDGRKIGRVPKSDAVQILLVSLSERFQIFSNQLAKTRKRATEKAVHDLRVSTRRLIAVMEVIRTIIPTADLSRARKDLKRLLNALSGLRDIQVQIKTVRTMVGEFPAMNLFLTLLMVREKHFLGREHSALFDIELGQIEDGIAEAGKALKKVLADPILRSAVGAIAEGKLAQAFSRAVQLKPAALSGKGNRIHRLRIAFKRFRYSVEAMEAMFPNVTPRTLKAMNTYQVRMGSIQDIDVLTANVREYARKHPGADQSQLKRLIGALQNRRSQLVLEFISFADELNLFWKKIEDAN